MNRRINTSSTEKAIKIQNTTIPSAIGLEENNEIEIEFTPETLPTDKKEDQAPTGTVTRSGRMIKAPDRLDL